MIFDWYSFYNDKSVAEIKALSIDCFSKIKLLFTAKGESDDAKKFHKELVYGLRNPRRRQSEIKPEYPLLIQEALNFLDKFDQKIPIINNLNAYPPSSFFLQFTFTLATPYLSKDDEEFYICENPIRKDKVFKVPTVSGSTWKGNMRWTARQINGLNPDKHDDEVIKRIKRLFGNEKVEEKKFHRGRLNFYPTFFDQISLEVINPHDRKTKAGTMPIYIESVPVGASGTFSLLYVPFDLLGNPLKEVKKQVVEDINLVCDALKEMMLTYGFSAKKSSGFGVIKDEFKEDGSLSGLIQIKGEKPKEEKFSSFEEMSKKIEDMLKPLGVEL